MPPARSADGSGAPVPPLPSRPETTLSPNLSASNSAAAAVANASLIDAEGDGDADGDDVNGGGDVGSDEGDAQEHLRPNGGGGDPYANLDGAFGRYIAEDGGSKPTSNGARKSGEDLLF